MASQLDRLRQACLERGVNGIYSIGRTFNTFDEDGNRRLSREELGIGLEDYGVSMSQDDVSKLFSYLDKSHQGSIVFDDFLLALRPPMSPERLQLVDAAFAKMDSSGDGVITLADLEKSYDVSFHEKIKSGEMTEEQVLQEFLENFNAGSNDDTVTKQDFLNYYAGVSSSIDEDDYFVYMMQQAWKL